MCLKRVDCMTKLDRVRNENVKRPLGQEVVVDMVKKVGKVRMKYMNGDRLVKQVFKEVTGGIPRGRLNVL